MTDHVLDARTALEHAVEAGTRAAADDPQRVAFADQAAAHVTDRLDAQGVDRTDIAQARAAIAGFTLGWWAHILGPGSFTAIGMGLLACTVDHRPEGRK